MRFFSSALLVFIAATAALVSAQSPSMQLVNQFDQIVQDIAALGQTMANAQGSTPDLSLAEAGLVKLGKALDDATQAAKMYTDFMSSQDAGKIASDLFESVVIIKKITEAVKQAKPLFDQYKYSDWIAQILQGLEAQFDALNKAFSPHLQKDDRNAISAVFVTIICLMDDAANTLSPGSALTTQKFCKYYGTHPGSSFHDYQSCAKKPIPSLPRKCKGFSDCGNSATNYMQFGYDNNCTASMQACQSTKWCGKSHHPVSPKSWTPPTPYCSGNKHPHPKHPSHPSK